MSTQQPQATLYERLGGIYSIATVVDDFIDRIMVDPHLNANPRVDEAHHKVPPPGFKYLVTEMVGWATGGPQRYTGRSMADSHRDRKITPKEWDVFLDDFKQTLDKFNLRRGAGGAQGDCSEHVWRHRYRQRRTIGTAKH